MSYAVRLICYNMRSILVSSVFILCVACASLKAGNDCVYPQKVGNQPDYYWRDYFGVIPMDAVPGGYDEIGNVTYIGQLPAAAHPGIYPGNLYPGKKEAVASLGKKEIDGTYVKILCSSSANKFEWIQTTASDSHLLTDYHWVIGGAQGTSVTYIGRDNFEGQVQIGRVFDSKSNVKGLWLYNKAGVQLNFQSFELLVVAR